MTPAIAGLLTTQNRAYLLPRVLDALERQTLPAERFEIVAIDDGSTDATPSVLAAYAERLPLRIIHQGASGLAAAKNLGVFATGAPIVVFLDDDDVADPDLLRAHLAAHESHPNPATAVLGHTRLDPDVARSPVMRHVTEVGNQLFSYGWMKPGQTLKYTEFWGGRSSCKRDFLLMHGVFDPAFRFGCEDIECAWRLRPHGLQVIYEPAASASMIRAISFDDFCKRSYRQGRSQFLFGQLHPDPEVRKYCELDEAAAAWAEGWQDYAAVLRRARELDALATARSRENTVLPRDDQRELDAIYRKAFFLSRAKGVADALSLVNTPPRIPGAPRHGLHGNFDQLLQRFDAELTMQSERTSGPETR